jgi:hypothetical protein
MDFLYRFIPAGSSTDHAGRERSLVNLNVATIRTIGCISNIKKNIIYTGAGENGEFPGGNGKTP